MSHPVNTELYELAAEHLSYWEGEGIGKLLQADLDDNDLDALRAHLKESARIMFEQEFQNDDPTTDERAETMFREANDVY